MSQPRKRRALSFSSKKATSVAFFFAWLSPGKKKSASLPT
jgi:hypothetical protein